MAQLEINTESRFPRDYLERAVRAIYPISAFFGEWAVAAAGRDTQFHNAIALQFAMNDTIEIGELAEGLARVQAGRSDGSPLPDLPAFEGLLIAAELIDPSTHSYIGEPYRFENNGTGFIHMVVKNSPGQVIHIDELSQRLAELAVNPTTTAHYASYQAGLRRDVSGVLVYAAGAKPTDEEMRAVRRQGELSNHETDIQFTIAAGEVSFNIVLGTALLYRGAFTIPAAARSFVEDEYLVQCACGKEFDSKARISPGNQWNISYLTNHLCVEHEVRPGRSIQLKTQGGTLTAQI